MNSRSLARGTAALVAVLVAACSDAPSAVRMSPADYSLGRIPGNPSADSAKANIEFFEVCKTYRGGTGPAVTIDVAVSGTSTPTNYQVSLADGECKDIWLHGGTADQVTVTEQVPAGYTASYVKEVITRTGYTIHTEVAGNSASGNVSGTPGEGTLFWLYNTLIPPPPPPPPASCTLTQGYWKNHAEDWDAAGDNKPFLASDKFYNSGVTYLALMGTPPKGGNAYIQLAHQFIAARLNVNGLVSATPGVTAVLQGADAFFQAAAAGTPNPTGATKTQVQAWAGLLARFNEGTVGPGHCD